MVNIGHAITIHCHPPLSGVYANGNAPTLQMWYLGPACTPAPTRAAAYYKIAACINHNTSSTDRAAVLQSDGTRPSIQAGQPGRQSQQSYESELLWRFIWEWRLWQKLFNNNNNKCEYLYYYYCYTNRCRNQNLKDENEFSSSPELGGNEMKK